MLGHLLLTLPLFSLAFLATASPLEPRAITSGLLGDVLNNILSLSNVGQLIKDVINGIQSGIDNTKTNKPWLCLDACCVWYDVSAELTKSFLNTTNGQCTDYARAAIRFGFHDAGAWNKTSPSGGADGSLMMDFGEINRPENNGLQDVRMLLRTVQAKYGVGYADLAQFAHNHATATCPKGPRIRTFVGRKDAKGPPPDGLLPDVHASADSLIQLFADKGFDAHDLAALVGAHAAAKQRFVDTKKAGFPLDTTPGVWDVEFYNDTLQNPPNPNIFVLPSDKVLSVHPKINDEWRAFVGNQPHWNEDYAKAYLRMSLLGVDKDTLNSLKDCTKVLPATRSS